MAGHHHGSGRALLFSVILTMTFAVVEAVGGWLSGSLALLSDAGHMLTDSGALAIGAIAAWVATKPGSQRHSFGLQRAETLGGLVNVVLMFAVVVAVVMAAIRRLQHPPDVAGGTVMLIAFIGLLVNIGVAYVLLRGEQTLNVRAALLHVIGDLLGSVAALAAGVVIYFTGWMPIDPILSLFVSLLIAVSAVRLLREIAHILLEGVPHGLNADAIAEALTEPAGVRSVHDLHVWTLSSRYYALSAHVTVQSLSQWQAILPQLQQLLHERFGIAHSTLQPEDESLADACRDNPACTVTMATAHGASTHHHH